MICGRRSSAGAAARCSVIPAKPPAASRSGRRVSSAASRASRRAARSSWARVTTAPQCGRAVSAVAAAGATGSAEPGCTPPCPGERQPRRPPVSPNAGPHVRGGQRPLSRVESSWLLTRKAASHARSCCTRSLAPRLTHRACWRRDYRACLPQPGRAADPRTPGGRRHLGGQPGPHGRSVARRAAATPRQGPQVHRAGPPPAQQRPPRVHLRHHPGGGGDGGGRPGPGPPAGQRGARRIPPGRPGGGRAPG